MNETNSECEKAFEKWFNNSEMQGFRDDIMIQSWRAAWNLQQAKITSLQSDNQKLREALKKIANQDYRGNRPTESQIAFAALAETKEEK